LVQDFVVSQGVIFFLKDLKTFSAVLPHSGAVSTRNFELPLLLIL